MVDYIEVFHCSFHLKNEITLDNLTFTLKEERLSLILLSVLRFLEKFNEVNAMYPPSTICRYCGSLNHLNLNLVDLSRIHIGLNI